MQLCAAAARECRPLMEHRDRRSGAKNRQASAAPAAPASLSGAGHLADSIGLGRHRTADSRRREVFCEDALGGRPAGRRQLVSGRWNAGA